MFAKELSCMYMRDDRDYISESIAVPFNPLENGSQGAAKERRGIRKGDSETPKVPSLDDFLFFPGLQKSFG